MTIGCIPNGSPIRTGRNIQFGPMAPMTHVWRYAGWWRVRNPAWFYANHPRWAEPYPNWIRADHAGHPQWFKSAYWHDHPRDWSHPERANQRLSEAGYQKPGITTQKPGYPTRTAGYTQKPGHSTQTAGYTPASHSNSQSPGYTQHSGPTTQRSGYTQSQQSSHPSSRSNQNNGGTYHSSSTASGSAHHQPPAAPAPLPSEWER